MESKRIAVLALHQTEQPQNAEIIRYTKAFVKAWLGTSKNYRQVVDKQTFNSLFDRLQIVERMLDNKNEADIFVRAFPELAYSIIKGSPAFLESIQKDWNGIFNLMNYTVEASDIGLSHEDRRVLVQTWACTIAPAILLVQRVDVNPNIESTFQIQFQIFYRNA